MISFLRILIRVAKPKQIVALSVADETQVPVKYEHQTMHSSRNGKPAPAAGWVKRFETRPDGIWGLVEWTTAAFSMISGKEYRFISPTVRCSPLTKEVMRIENAALTNQPALTLTPLSKEARNMQELERITTALGLERDASLETILCSISEMQAGRPDPSQFVPLSQVQQMVAAVAADNAAVSEERVQQKVENAITSGKLPPVLKPWAIEYCTADAQGFETFIGSLPVMLKMGREMLPALPAGGTESSRYDDTVASQLAIDARDM